VVDARLPGGNTSTFTYDALDRQGKAP
jgi:YD repeat-containing protein